MLPDTRAAMLNGANPYAQTFSGRPVYLLDPKAAEIDWHDMVYHLAHQNRYAGAAGNYSVAQHSVHVAHSLPKRLRLPGLLHDAPEYAYGDWTKPAQQAFTALLGPAFKIARRRLDDGLAAAIHEKAGLPWPPSEEDAARIKHADTRVTMTEKRDLLAQMEGKTDADWLLDGRVPVEPLTMRIEPWPVETVIRVFSDELRTCGLDV